MGTVIGWLTNWAKPYLVPIIATIIAALLALVLSFGFMYNNSVKDAAIAKADLSALEVKVDDANKQVEIDKTNQAQTTVERAKTNQDYLDAKRAVEGFKGREEVLRAKPKLTEKLINKSFDKFTDDISCITGDNTPCSKK